jgi:hypothetical protein
MDVSEYRYCVFFGIVAGSFEGLGRVSSGVRAAMTSKPGCCWT